MKITKTQLKRLIKEELSDIHDDDQSNPSLSVELTANEIDAVLEAITTAKLLPAKLSGGLVARELDDAMAKLKNALATAFANR
jgi:hypothetical protein|tara:strand:+ start:341 stop:589 length:249 start_codon:yes stop_codon:yes gene_type:complete